MKTASRSLPGWPPLPRRAFLNTCVSLAALSSPGVRLFGAPPGPRIWKAAIIGHTGRGNYGHEHEVIFNNRPNVRVVAVADPDEAGRRRAAERSGAERSYAEYRQMLTQEKPDLVAITPRWTDQRHAMGMAAIDAGAHLYFEKPFTRSVAEADDLLAAAAAKNLKICVAHQMRLAPSTQFLARELKGGFLGQLLALHAHGKQDQRAGAEDMIVLGSHLFDLMRLFAGDPLWCSARVLEKDHEITIADARRATEDLGLIAGTNVQAQFAFPDSVWGAFTSRADQRDTSGPWGIELVGAKGRIRLLADVLPRLFLYRGTSWPDAGSTGEWRPLPNDPGAKVPKDQRGFLEANRRVVDDWLEAIERDRAPACSGAHAAKAIEMIQAVFAAGLSQRRVSLPLQERSHPVGRTPASSRSS